MIPRGQEHIGECMRRRLLELKNTALRHLVVTGVALLIGAGSAFAQSGTPNPPDQAKQQPGQADANANAAREANQRKVEEFVEAQQAINGPAGNPECVWLGRRVVVLMWRDDLDTAFRHLDLYDRFGCPGGHVQATFRCLVKFGPAIDPKVADSLNRHVHACWINPNATPQPAALTQPGTPAAAAPAAQPPQTDAKPDAKPSEAPK